MKIYVMNTTKSTHNLGRSSFKCFNNHIINLELWLESRMLKAFVATKTHFEILQYRQFIYSVQPWNGFLFSVVCTDNKDWHKSIIFTQISSLAIGFTCQGNWLMQHSHTTKKKKRISAFRIAYFLKKRKTIAFQIAFCQMYVRQHLFGSIVSFMWRHVKPIWKSPCSRPPYWFLQCTVWY